MVALEGVVLEMADIVQNTEMAVEKDIASQTKMAEMCAVGEMGHAMGMDATQNNVAMGLETLQQTLTKESQAFQEGVAALPSMENAAATQASSAEIAQMQAQRNAAMASVMEGTSIAPPESKIAIPTAQSAYERRIMLLQRLAAHQQERQILRSTYQSMLMDMYAQILDMNALLDASKCG